MTTDDWAQLIRLLQGLGLVVVHVDTSTGEVLVRVPPTKGP